MINLVTRGPISFPKLFFKLVLTIMINMAKMIYKLDTCHPEWFFRSNGNLFQEWEKIILII
jgi:hypothetical protein